LIGLLPYAVRRKLAYLVSLRLSSSLAKSGRAKNNEIAKKNGETDEANFA